MMTDKFQLRITVVIAKTGDKTWSPNEHLSFMETIDLGSMGFLGVAEVLNRFHELATTVKQERENA